MNNQEYKPCPFCKGEITRCGETEEDPHTCHFLVCRKCKVEFSVVTEEDPETIEELQAVVQKRWNAL